MSTDSRKRPDRKGYRQGGTPPRSKPKKKVRKSPPCSICQRPIQDMLSALADSNDGSAVHFDCALKLATDSLKPKDGEKVIYCGSGAFAAIDESSYQQNKLKIFRTINWENPANRNDLLNQLSVPI